MARLVANELYLAITKFSYVRACVRTYAQLSIMVGYRISDDQLLKTEFRLRVCMYAIINREYSLII